MSLQILRIDMTLNGFNPYFCAIFSTLSKYFSFLQHFSALLHLADRIYSKRLLNNLGEAGKMKFYTTDKVETKALSIDVFSSHMLPVETYGTIAALTKGPKIVQSIIQDSLVQTETGCELCCLTFPSLRQTSQQLHLVPALVKGVYLDTVVCVLLQDLLRIFICVEGVHEHQWYICVVGLVQMLQNIV